MRGIGRYLRCAERTGHSAVQLPAEVFGERQIVCFGGQGLSGERMGEPRLLPPLPSPPPSPSPRMGQSSASQSKLPSVTFA